MCKVKSLDSVQAHSQKILLGSSDFGEEATSLWFKTNWCMCVRSYCFYFKIILHSSNTVEYHAHASAILLACYIVPSTTVSDVQKV